MLADEWVTGDRLGLPIPAHAEALKAGGEAFLTRAFHAAGTLGPDNRVTRITGFENHAGGSTGRTLRLSVTYEHPAPGLHEALFVKFSRDFDDPIRDRAKNQLEAEVSLALLSRRPGFPIAVPACLFADYHRASGTGLLVTQQVGFGRDGIEPLHGKCLDDRMPQPVEHYRALIRALARLAGTHRAGGLGKDVSQLFPFDPDAAAAMDRIRYSREQLHRRVDRYAAFAKQYPQLLPAHVRDPAFIARLSADIPRFLEQEHALRAYLHSRPDFIALCHWNANVDNAWFWRNAQGQLECGLMDWGRAGQMSIALALFGTLSGAGPEIWDRHLGELLALFAGEFQGWGGPALDTGALEFHLLLFVALMGLAWLMDAPALVQREFPDLSAIRDRLDPRFRENETARVQLHMMTTVLHLWQGRDFGRLLDRFAARRPE